MTSYEYLNAIIKIGLNAKNNWELLDESNKNDLWFHLDNYPSCYVIVSHDKKNQFLDSIIKYASKLCYVYSRNKVPKSKKAVCVCYTKCKYVTKGKTVGEAILLKKPKKYIHKIEEM
tara:strand:+ start:220 stop:570 length:351 start_codon:yes stop_codon:yes gene_type:complete